MLIAMAGWPGSGKSTLAACLERELGAVVLDKDRVRAALYQAAAAILKASPRQAVVVDGRTFLLAGQVRPLLDLAASLGERPRIIACVCDDEAAGAGPGPPRRQPHVRPVLLAEGRRRADSRPAPDPRHG